MSRPRSSFSPLYSNCPKQWRIFNCCDQVYLQTIKRGQELYTDPRGISINWMLLIGQLMWMVNTRKEEKSNTYTYYKHEKEQSTSGGHCHWIILFNFCSETNTDQGYCLFCVIQSSTSNTVSFNRFFNARDNDIFSIVSLIVIVNPDPIEDYMNGSHIIVSN